MSRKIYMQLPDTLSERTFIFNLLSRKNTYLEVYNG